MAIDIGLCGFDNTQKTDMQDGGGVANQCIRTVGKVTDINWPNSCSL
jgi:hypothetical protein